MKLPKVKKMYCPFCKTHTEHKVIQVKAKTRSTAHPLSKGGKPRLKARGLMHSGNKGKYSRPPVKKWKMYNRKTSKKVDLRFKCSKCKKQHGLSKGGFRAKKIELK
ncbi:50S ribosomal protein L44e [Candidatus Woesearchaeota archaeon]|nr:MAG: 50S ribosomal protein L44e [Candidatus Woesearchaeota archaeon ex4484_78]RLE45579.1 MAG: 50S ribosomal protein L44e [Candidatus Woesearchaeota archaeon]